MLYLEVAAGFKNNWSTSFLEYQHSRNKTVESFLKHEETSSYDTLCLIVRVAKYRVWKGLKKAYVMEGKRKKQRFLTRKTLAKKSSDNKNVLFY